MIDTYNNLSDAANDASNHFEIPIDASDLLALIRLGLLPSVSNLNGSDNLLRVSDVRRFAGNVGYHAGIEGLFTDLTSLFRQADDRTISDALPVHTINDVGNGGVVFIQLSPSLGLSFVLGQSAVEQIQLFTSLLRRERVGTLKESGLHMASVRLCRVDLDPNVALWSLQELDQQLIRDLWRRSTCDEVSTSHTETLTIPKLYGNKIRILPFLAAIARQYVPDTGVICDLMSGTGIVSRAFSRYFEVYANDGNHFAALLTRSQAMSIPNNVLSEFIEKMSAFYEQNATALMDLFGEGFSVEAGFLHGKVDSSSLQQYRRYCEMSPYIGEGNSPPVTGDQQYPDSTERSRAETNEIIAARQRYPTSFPYCMATIYYSNAYFGLSQAIALDSIRFAIDKCTTGGVRDFCLAALPPMSG